MGNLCSKLWKILTREKDADKVEKQHAVEIVVETQSHEPVPEITVPEIVVEQATTEYIQVRETTAEDYVYVNDDEDNGIENKLP